MLFYAPEVLAEMRAICASSGVLFIADEVMTGFGRTGSLLACEQAEVVPDILCLSKGLTGGSIPLAVTLASEPIFAAHYSTDRGRMFFHSSSYTANPIACAAANANLAIWREEPVLDRVEDLARRQAAQIEQLRSHPRVSGARTLGTIAAFEVCGGQGYLSQVGPQLQAFFRERDILLRPLGDTIYVMPPFSITDADHDRVYAAIQAALCII
jgi:adenosylmethionine-8-amino-7-oxononanoate aminotransferase